MKKDFDTWNNLKKETDGISDEVFFRRREIWWCKIGLNIGYEQDGKGRSFRRPVLILRKLSRYTFIGIPITTKAKEGHIFKKLFLSNGEWRNACIGQIKVFDEKRLIGLLDTIDPNQFFSIVKAVQNLIEPLTSSFSDISSETASLEVLPEANISALYQEWKEVQVFTS